MSAQSVYSHLLLFYGTFAFYARHPRFPRCGCLFQHQIRHKSQLLRPNRIHLEFQMSPQIHILHYFSYLRILSGIRLGLGGKRQTEQRSVPFILNIRQNIAH